MLKKTVFVYLLMISAQALAANDCVLHFTRVACPGKEAISFEKCDGKASCDKEKDATSEKDCAKKALKECENARLDITKSKEITATYKGQPVNGGKNFCAADRPDFNKCK